MSSPIEMPIDAVRRHAATVSQVSAQVSTAHQAASQVYLDVAAFGMLCSFLPGLFDPVLRSTVEAIDGAAGTLQDTSGKLQLAANLAEAADIANAATVHNAGTQTIEIPL